MAELVVLKLGGSVITKKAEGKAEVNSDVLERLAREISEAMKEREFQLVIVHGAGPFGHVPAKEYGLDTWFKDERQLEGFSVTHHSMEKLNFLVVEALRKEGINAIEFQPSSIGILNNEELVHFPTEALEGILNLGLVPVAYGDVLVDREKGISILSGDHLVPYLARRLKASRVVIATDVAGIFDSDPRSNKEARLIPEINPENAESLSLGDSTSTDVTGGMRRKVKELLSMEIDSEIISALEPGLVKRALLGEKNIGTIIRK